MASIVFIVALYLALCAGVGVLGEKRHVGAGLAFFLSLILSPLIGLIIVALSSRNEQSNNDKVSRLKEDLKEISEFRKNGTLTEEEFMQAKAKILKG
jgi:hypothetical protein